MAARQDSPTHDGPVARAARAKPVTRSAGTGRAHAGDFPVRPTMRSPARELGPRANRTIARILEATRAILLARGYAGTTIDEIARVAGLSRGSFYTYFPTKRDVLLALGADSARAATVVVERLEKLGEDWTTDDLEAFVGAYFEMLDQHGSFAFAWTQAAHEDDEIRVAGMKRHLEMAHQMGVAAGTLRGNPFDHPTARGLVIFSMLERAWAYCQVYTSQIDVVEIRRELAGMLASTLRDTQA